MNWPNIVTKPKTSNTTLEKTCSHAHMLARTHTIETKICINYYYLSLAFSPLNSKNTRVCVIKAVLRNWKVIKCWIHKTQSLNTQIWRVIFGFGFALYEFLEQVLLLLLLSVDNHHQQKQILRTSLSSLFELWKLVICSQ